MDNYIKKHACGGVILNGQDGPYCDKCGAFRNVLDGEDYDTAINDFPTGIDADANRKDYDNGEDHSHWQDQEDDYDVEKTRILTPITMPTAYREELIGELAAACECTEDFETASMADLRERVRETWLRHGKFDN